jgi:hypothetical protein
MGFVVSELDAGPRKFLWCAFDRASWIDEQMCVFGWSVVGGRWSRDSCI